MSTPLLDHCTPFSLTPSGDLPPLREQKAYLFLFFPFPRVVLDIRAQKENMYKAGHFMPPVGPGTFGLAGRPECENLAV